MVANSFCPPQLRTLYRAVTAEGKLRSLSLGPKKDRWNVAFDVVLDQDWTIDDLKATADPNSWQSSRATELGFSDGIAPGFKKELSRYKAVWRTEDAATALNRLAGGFIAP
jgi:hypothetical protein